MERGAEEILVVLQVKSRSICLQVFLWTIHGPVKMAIGSDWPGGPALVIPGPRGT